MLSRLCLDDILKAVVQALLQTLPAIGTHLYERKVTSPCDLPSCLKASVLLCECLVSKAYPRHDCLVETTLLYLF